MNRHGNAWARRPHHKVIEIGARVCNPGESPPYLDPYEEAVMDSRYARYSFALLIAVLACGTPVQAEIAPVEYVDISPSVVMAENPNGSNITCIALDDGLVFVDTGLVTSIAADFRKAMEQRFDRPTKYLLLTHAHIDHIFAMGAFADVEVVAASSEKLLFEQQLAIEWNEDQKAMWAGVFPAFMDAFDTAEPFLPTVWVDGEKTFGSGDSAAVFATTGGHTVGSSYVWFPSEGVLVGGDLVQVDRYPYFGDQTNDLTAWIKALKAWHAMEPASICPGHGRVVDKDYLRLEWEYFEELIAALTKLKAEGVPVEEVVVHESLPAAYWPDQTEPRWWKYCIALCYRSL
jgi:glyoxylase-like metal-dependent hydrolase (beta-lactamase superfamily II)